MHTVGSSTWAKIICVLQDDPDGIPENIHEMDIMDMNVLDEADMGNGGGDEFDEDLPDSMLDDENEGGLKEDSTNICDDEVGGDAVISRSDMEDVSIGL